MVTIKPLPTWYTMSKLVPSYKLGDLDNRYLDRIFSIEVMGANVCRCDEERYGRDSSICQRCGGETVTPWSRDLNGQGFDEVIRQCSTVSGKGPDFCGVSVSLFSVDQYTVEVKLRNSRTYACSCVDPSLNRAAVLAAICAVRKVREELEVLRMEREGC